MYLRKQSAIAIEFIRVIYDSVCTRWGKYVNDLFRNVPYILGFTLNIYLSHRYHRNGGKHPTKNACDNIKRYLVIWVDHDVNIRNN